MDFERIARELLGVLRGKRSQVAWSRRLGYRSNVAYAWESGRRSPTAAEALRAVQRSGIDLEAALVQFFAGRPPWLDEVSPSSPEGVAALLEELRGNTSITELARRSSLSRYSVSRWLAGRTQPRLPDFLRLIEAASGRLVDWLAALVDPEQLPSVRERWRRIRARRRGAQDHPWAAAVLRALELEDYRALPAHDPGWIAERFGISLDEVTACLGHLSLTGQIVQEGAHWVPDALAQAPALGRPLEQHWTRVGRERIEAGAPGQFSYNVFTVSRDDHERIREAHLDYVEALRAIVAGSTVGETVAVANVQLFALDEGDTG